MIQETNHNVDDLTPFQQWQIDRYGNILTSTGELLTHDEVKEQEVNKQADDMNAHFERQLYDHWNY